MERSDRANHAAQRRVSNEHEKPTPCSQNHEPAEPPEDPGIPFDDGSMFSDGTGSA
ncbi:hypothetical protein HFO24_17005 [Rhizobium laguerreae]|uniref:hypothetical protein n=1 Tax=Rhizobium laguerreae TaxID=1076926 RepID=UPI001C91D445|nr:hypothetical protein [Rhizobium laguerreae]MBY3183353.1 hypothetical protein [Rhizobium laguerreae]